MRTEWAYSDTLWFGGILLGAVAGSVHIFQYYRQHRHEAGIRGHLLFNSALLVSLIAAAPTRSALRDLVVVVCMVAALIGLGMSWWEKRRRRSEPPAAVT